MLTEYDLKQLARERAAIITPATAATQLVGVLDEIAVLQVRGAKLARQIIAAES